MFFTCVTHMHKHTQCRCPLTDLYTEHASWMRRRVAVKAGARLAMVFVWTHHLATPPLLPQLWDHTCNKHANGQWASQRTPVTNTHTHAHTHKAYLGELFVLLELVDVKVTMVTVTVMLV